MSEIYVFRNGKYVLVDAESEFPTKQAKVTFWEKDLSWKIDTVREFFFKIAKKFGDYVMVKGFCSVWYWLRTLNSISVFLFCLCLDFGGKKF